MGKKRAGDGNRTHVSSLEGWCSTIELHPQKIYEIFSNAQNRNRTSDTRIFSPLLYQLSYLGIYWAEVDSNHRSKLQQIYSLSPLATRESAHIILTSQNDIIKKPKNQVFFSSKIIAQ